MTSKPHTTMMQHTPRQSASLLRLAAGSPRSVQALSVSARPGSFLVLVVGTLALLAVVMLVYVSVGNQDIRTKAAVEKKERLDDVPKQFATYLAEQIIARDVTATWYDNANELSRRVNAPADEPVLMRESFDYPFTDPSRRSDTLDRRFAFDPVGTYVRVPVGVSIPTANDPTPNYTGTLPDRWVPSDSWLASTEPTWLGYTNNGVNDWVAGGLSAFRYEPSGVKRDWLKISNIAPDGKFVNLYNLAPNIGGVRIANFDARPGLGTLGTLPRLSENLSLFSGPTNFGNADTSGLITAWGANAAGLRNAPFIWDSWQRGLFRPATDQRTGVNGGSPEYALYQFADADGDGMLDSRWQELTDSRRFDANTTDPGLIFNLLESDGKYRYFFATRIIDASGLVNVNTATDLAAAPTATTPVGLTPADVDLRRLLTLRDVYDGFRAAPAAFSGSTGRLRAGYDGIIQPTSFPGITDPQGLLTSNYGPADSVNPSLDMPPAPDSGYDFLRAITTGHFGYTALRLTLATGTFVPDSPISDRGAGAGGPQLLEYRNNNLVTIFALSSFAKATGTGANSLDSRRNINRDVRDALGRRFWDFVPGQATSAEWLFPSAATLEASGVLSYPNLVGDPLPANVHAPRSAHFPSNPATDNFPFTPLNRLVGVYPDLALRRAQFYNNQATTILSSKAKPVTRTVGGTDVAITEVSTSGLFGIDDLSELLTYRASNDISVQSNLERVVGGRDKLPFRANTLAVAPNDPGVNTPDPRRFDPLRQNRGPDVEFARDLRGGPTDNLATPDGQVDRSALLQLHADVRQRLTTISGARQLYTKRDVNFDKVENSELKTPAVAVLDNATNPSLSGNSFSIDAANALLLNYASALMPTLTPATNGPAEWNVTDTTKTLFYGHQGPELALLTAARMTANMLDLYDADTQPRAMTLVLSRQAKTNLMNSDNIRPWRTQRFPYWHSATVNANNGNQLNLDRDLDSELGQPRTRLAVSGAADLTVPAVNVFGVEPQPFITAVANFTVFCDVPFDGTPDADEDGLEDPNDPNANPDPLTIRRAIATDNPDFLFRVLAFRLHNPFSTDIELSADPTGPLGQPLNASADLPFDTQENFYYIRYGGRTFLLNRLDDEAASYTGNATDLSFITPKGITIKAGRSIVCYALSQPKTAIAKRIGRAKKVNGDPGDPISPTILKNLIEAQFEGQGADLDLADATNAYFWVPEIYASPVEVPPEATLDPQKAGKIGSFTQATYDTQNDNVFNTWANEFDAALGQLMQPNVTGANITDDPSDPVSARLAVNTQVELWRTVRVGFRGATNAAQAKEYSTTGSGANAIFVRNEYSNDLLVDRLRFPYVEGTTNIVNLDARFTFPSGTLADATRHFDIQGSDVLGANVNNNGLTLALWAAVRRPQDPNVIPTNGTIPQGAFPGFCMEPKSFFDNAAATGNPIRREWNGYMRQSQTLSGIQWSNIRLTYFTEESRHGRAAGDDINTFISRFGNKNNEICTAISRSGLFPVTRPIRGLVQSTLINPDGSAKPMPANNSNRFDDGSGTWQSTIYSTEYAQVITGNAPTVLPAGAVNDENADRFISTFKVQRGRNAVAGANPTENYSTLRIADLLLPIGVGPTWAPLNSQGQLIQLAPGIEDTNTTWTTLGESMAAAMGYQELDLATPVFNNPSDITNLTRPINLGANPNDNQYAIYRHLFDRGNLILDDFVPFYNYNTDAAGNFDLNTDRRAHTQIPVALNILDMFSATVAGAESTNKAVPGLININTASLPVARVLPMLTPPSRDIWGATANFPARKANTVFTLTPPADPTVTFTITFQNPDADVTSATTVALPSTATSGMIQAALESLKNVGVGNISVTSGRPELAVPHPYFGNAKFIITCVGELSNKDLPSISVSAGTAAKVSEGSNVFAGPGWWWDGSSLNDSVDIAATLVAFRDKTEVIRRPQSWFWYNPSDPGGNTYASLAVAYPSVNNAGALVTPDRNSDDVTGRGAASQITGLSEIPGFQSLGALMTMRHHGYAYLGASPYDPYAFALPSNIDFLGYAPDQVTIPDNIPSPNPMPPADTMFWSLRGGNHSRIGVDSVLLGSVLPTRINTITATNVNRIIRTDGIEGEFKEKLAIVNGLINTVTTRSDYFIAWFVVHGYQKSDVENLGPTDVLTPSIARRFVMVVDRSSVTNSGDKPNILLFKEVPYKGN